MSIPAYFNPDQYLQNPYEDPIEIHLKYIADNGKGAIDSIYQGNYGIPLQNLGQEYIIQASKMILMQSEYFEDKFKHEWKDYKTIEISFDSLKQVEAFYVVLKFMHYTDTQTPISLLSSQGINKLKPGSGLDIELCIASNMLCLRQLQLICEQRLVTLLNINNILKAIFYASTYQSKDVLLSCFKWILEHGVSLAYSLKDVNTLMNTNIKNYNDNDKNKLIYIVSKNMFYYDGFTAYADIFDAIISDRLALQYYYFIPGYHSSGDLPCQLDRIHRESLIKPPPGFLNTTRCYIERIKGLGDKHTIQKFNLYREDHNQYVLTAIYIPEQKIIYFINNKTFSDYNSMSVYDNYIAYMKYNTLITDFKLYDNGIDTTTLPECVFPNLMQSVRCHISFKTNLTGRVPNSLKVTFSVKKDTFEQGIDGHYFFNDSFVKSFNEKEYSQKEQYSYSDKNTLNTSEENDRNENKSSSDELFVTPQYIEPELPHGPVTLVTKPASWSPQMKSWTLKFNQRSKVASKKNFQLINEDSLSDESPQVILLLGKISSRRYSMDYCSPLSSCQALAIATTAFVKKLLVN